MNYIVEGLNASEFSHLFGLTDEELQKHGAKRYTCDARPGFPDRIEMRDAEIGENLLLINHFSMDQDTPYRTSHAIFVREGAEDTYREKGIIPAVMFNRLLSLRAFDENGMMLDAEVAKGEEIEPAVLKLFRNPDVTFIDAHNAAQGCFSGRITRT